MQRPSAAELQQDPFVQSAALPELLTSRMAEHVARQRPVCPIISYPCKSFLQGLRISMLCSCTIFTSLWLVVSFHRPVLVPCARPSAKPLCSPLMIHYLCLHQVAASRQKAHAEAQLTLPKWEFGRADERGTVKAVRNMPTLKSHHLNNLTLSDGTLRSGTLQHRDLPPPHYLVGPACACLLSSVLFPSCSGAHWLV